MEMIKEAVLIYPPACYETGVGEKVFFDFEEDFVADDVRCIPMIVRFKLDACGIKLQLQEWSKFSAAERTVLATMDCSSHIAAVLYRHYLQRLVTRYTHKQAIALVIDENPSWADTDTLPLGLVAKLDECAWQISLQQWRALANLQRFVLLKLCRPGHENHNFPKAMKEFGLL